ncbi:MAG: hydroxymethylglutaryl-CoA synthase family protein [Lewinella sp.]|uniref:hydroxymethylglutaryl-CoA synthase family protein n=1 Tax=Lewinella sp. TaxID=2004506 RepID=UPI003D6C27A3
MEKYEQIPAGIDDLAAYIPEVYLPIATLADARGIEYAKLNKGLGLTAMAIPDVGEDAATMMANAVRELIEKNDLRPQQIGRMYLGTESAIDGAKPTATYALQMLQAYFTPIYGPDCFLNCDVVDLTFACIGAVDALQNTLDWVRAKEGRLGIVVAADNAKYELGSTGEYTQGAGAIATLVKRHPRLLAIDPDWGVSTRAVYDFYKPLRQVKKSDVIAEALQLASRNYVDVEQLTQQLQNGIEVKGVLDSNEQLLTLHKDTPVFDGPYSNDCYQERIKDALINYRHETNAVNGEPTAIQWDRLVFHLPYAFQARRMFGEIFWQETQQTAQAAALAEQIGLELPQSTDFEDEVVYQKALTGFWRAVTKTPLYRSFVAERIAPSEEASGQVGNMYAGSVFLALLGTLEAGLEQNNLSPDAVFGFFAYGSGSKSKVFQGRLQTGWEQVVQGFKLRQRLAERTAIDYATYEQLHRQALDSPVVKRSSYFRQTNITEDGKREYFIPASKEAMRPS